MKVIRQGSKGADVKSWQYFLLGQGLYPYKVDGSFGPRTHEATVAFQQKYGLPPDGVVGNRTMGQAMLLGYSLLVDSDTGQPGPNWPLRPAFEPLLGNDERARVFGRFRYKHQPVPGNPENIVVEDGWEANNIVWVDIPQVARINNNRTRIRFHKHAAKQFKGLWSAWEAAGLLDRAVSWQGSYVPRFIRGSRTTLSNHAFGTAFDINSIWNGLGVCPPFVGQQGCVRELVGIANQYGFYWGGHFPKRADGMHFEVAVLQP